MSLMPLHRPDPDQLEPPQAPDARHQGPAPVAPSSTGTPPTIDWAFVAEALHGLPPAMVDGFMADVVADARRNLAGLRDPSLPDDARMHVADRLRGSASIFGLVSLAEAAAAIERAVANEGDLWSALDSYVDALEGTAAQLAAGRPPTPASGRRTAANGATHH